jgi:hypothetical protein
MLKIESFVDFQLDFFCKMFSCLTSSLIFISKIMVFSFHLIFKLNLVYNFLILIIVCDQSSINAIPLIMES